MAEQLTCGSCGFGNEPERVYCHNCGAKLDRSLLPKVEPEKGDSVGAARRRIKKMTNPSGYSAKDAVKSLFNVIFWAALIAAIFLISQKPDGVPVPSKDLPQRLLQSELMEATQSPVSRTIVLTEAEATGAVKQTLKRSTSGDGGIPGVEFQGAYVVFRPGVVHIGAEQSLMGYPIFSGVDYKLMIGDGKLRPFLLGGNLGRLQIHPAAMQYLDVLFQKLWGALQRERGQMDRMQAIDVRAGQIIMITKPVGAK